ncbi:hypothetical protein HYQ46_011793 [Verticillium longisporum]|nr:hypothetical protein HYQ46_011793 [Verticillium longisporum]
MSQDCPLPSSRTRPASPCAWPVLSQDSHRVKAHNVVGADMDEGLPGFWTPDSCGGGGCPVIIGVLQCMKTCPQDEYVEAARCIQMFRSPSTRSLYRGAGFLWLQGHGNDTCLRSSPCRRVVPVKHQAAMRALKLATEAVAKNGYTGVFKTAGQKALQKGKNDKALSAEKRAAADQQEAGEYSARRLAAADRLAQAAERSAAAAEVSAAALQQIAGSLAKLVTIQSEIRENYTLVNHDALVGAADDEEDGENQEGDGEVAA